jgi:hypothetical protein
MSNDDDDEEREKKKKKEKEKEKEKGEEGVMKIRSSRSVGPQTKSDILVEVERSGRRRSGEPARAPIGVETIYVWSNRVSKGEGNEMGMSNKGKVRDERADRPSE